MASMKRLARSFVRLFLPNILLIVAALLAGAIFLNYSASNPPRATYLVTPEKYGRLSPRAAQITDESWTNGDGSSARGWLLRGTPGSPAIIILHRYGADRSWVLDLGVKINEATNYTILMPDARGHGENPLVKRTTLGGCETNDLLAAIAFLRSLRNPDQSVALVGNNLGVYGVELGAYSALSAASKDESIKALALDSVPMSSGDLLSSVIENRFPVAGPFTAKLAVAGSYPYQFSGCYNQQSLRGAAESLADRKVLLLAGGDTPKWQDSTKQLAAYFSNSVQVESNVDLPTSGYGINNAAIEQASAYDQRVVDFFKRALGYVEPVTQVEAQAAETPTTNELVK